MVKRIVSVQDISCLGQCSLTVALPILSAFGVEVSILPSAILSTHTGGFQSPVIHDLTDEMPKIIAHWQKEGLKFDAIYTGYIGDSRQFDTITTMRELLNPGGLLIVDPAMADHGRLYSALNSDIVDGMRRHISTADVILPNMTEAALLLKRDYIENPSEYEVEEMLKALCALGPRYGVLTGVCFEEGKIGAACYDRERNRFAYYFTKRVEKNFHGTGDIFASVMTACILNDMDMHDCLREACEFTAACIRATVKDDLHTYGVHFEEVLQKRMHNNR